MRIYLDHNATTAPAEPVVEAMTRAMRDWSATPPASTVSDSRRRAPSTSHAAGRGGAGRRRAVRGGLHRGGTEADNLAIRGVAEALEPAGRRANRGQRDRARGDPEDLAPSRSADGRVTVAAGRRAAASSRRTPMQDAVSEETALVSVMHANNEIGTMQPVAEMAALAHARGALVHTDAVQTAGKMPVDVRALGVDLLSLSGPQVLRPQGRRRAVGAPRRAAAAASMTGGRQERNRRAGTENVAGDRRHGRRSAAGARDAAEAPRLDGAARSARSAACCAACRAPPSTARADRACRTPRTSASNASRPSRCSSRSTSKASRSPPVGLLVRHARALARAQGDGPATGTRRRARSASASAPRTPKPRSTASSACCRPWSRSSGSLTRAAVGA